MFDLFADHRIRKEPNPGSMDQLTMMLRSISFILALLAIHQVANAKNYIKYHQRSLVVQELMLQGEYQKALKVLSQLDRRYGLMPTETVARAICLTSVGDTAAARSAYLKSVDQRSDLAWTFHDIPTTLSGMDTVWFEQVVSECFNRWRAMGRYADGPNPGLPTPTTELNKRHQYLYDHSLPDEQGQREYEALIEEHNALFLRFVSGGLPVPSIADYGINSEFSTFLIHCSPELTTANEKTLKRWLKAGVIYPVLYATPFDDLANHRNEPFPYGTFSGLRAEDMLPGHEKRRARIGMGDEHLERLRFNRPIAPE